MKDLKFECEMLLIKCNSLLEIINYLQGKK